MTAAALLFVSHITYSARPLLSIARPMLLLVVTPFASTVANPASVYLPRTSSCAVACPSSLVVRLRTSRPFRGARIMSFTGPSLPRVITVPTVVFLLRLLRLLLDSSPFPVPLVAISAAVRSCRLAIIHRPQPQPHPRFEFLFLLQCEVVAVRFPDDGFQEPGIWLRSSCRGPKSIGTLSTLKQEIIGRAATIE